MTDYSIFTGPGAPVIGVPPPVASTAFGAAITLGSGFKVTTGTLYLKGYRYWTADAAGNHGPQAFALWQAHDSTATYALVPAGTVTSGAFTSGAWNTVLLPAPIPLSQGVPYIAATGFTGAFNFTTTFWTTGGPGSAGLANGPLQFWSDAGAALPDPFGNHQSVFTTGGTADPTITPPAGGNSSFNCWIDVIITDVPPAGATFRVWPNLPVPTTPFGVADDIATIATQFSLSQAGTVANIWHYSPATATALPTQCAIWAVSGQSIVAAVAAPAWSGAAGSGWVSCTNLPAGIALAAAAQYKVASFRNAAGSVWFQAADNYFITGNGSAGLTNGILTAPDNAGASPGQGSLDLSGAVAYPGTTNGEGFWVDVEVAPASAPPPSGVAGQPGVTDDDPARRIRRRWLRGF